jgi:hypothetical protein
MMGMFRQSKRRVSLFRETLLNHPVSIGLVVKHQQQTSNAVAAACEELVQLIPQQYAICADETPTRQQNQNAWIWTVVATTFTVFRIRLTKAAWVIKELLGDDFKGVATSDRATAATCSELLNHFDNLWLFVYCKNVEPTNNAAERSLRHAVIWKHLSFGTQGEHGSRFVERLLTVIETCRQQKRNAFDFLVDSLTAQNASTKPPQLLAGA